jgi:uncharacterized protein DUF5989
MSENADDAFQKLAAEQGQMSLLGEFWYFLKHNKKWWLLPILVVMLLFGLLMLLTSSPMAPFIYSLF